MNRFEDACKEVQEISRRLAMWVHKQPAIGEESATDWLLYEIAERLPFVTYRKFTRHQESRESGADWDWWFVLRQGAIGLRVQAKKVVEGTDHYRGLAHTSRSGLQIEMLLDSSREENLLGFYALYADPGSARATMCRGKIGDLGDQGVFLAAAPVLYQQFISPGRQRVEAEALIRHSNPLSCLFCCPMAIAGGGGDADGLYEYIRNYYPTALGRETETETRGYHDVVPPHVSSLLQFSQGDSSQWWEDEYGQAIKATRAILIFDLRRLEHR